MKRSIWFWLCFFICIILAVYFSVRIIMTGMGRSTLSHVHNISINTNTRDKDLSALASAITLPPGTNTYSVNLENLNARIGAIPGIQKSAVRRTPSGNLAIKASFYQAVALWTDGENFFPLSADGTIVNTPQQTRDEGNVVFRGKIPNNITDITKAAHNLVGELDYIEWIENRRWNLTTVDGTVIMLPESNPIAAIGSLMTLHRNHDILNKKLNVIDMRDDARILVK